MKNVIVKIEAKTSQVFLNKKTLGINGENLQGEIIFEFTDEFVNGVAWLEVQMPNGEKGYLECTKNNDTYTLPILSSLLTEVGNIEMQLRITENEDANGIPVFKSNKFYLEVKEAINSITTIPEEYPTWIDTANAKINEINIAIEDSVIATENAIQKGSYAKEQGDYAKEQGESVEENISEIRTIAERAEDKSDTAISISKGANQALSFGDYVTMISVFNNLNNDIYRTGQNILIVTLNVPDLWISAIEEESTPYTFVDDETFTNELKTNGMVKVGYYILSALETQKVDLTEYVKNTDYPTSSTAGVVRATTSYGTQITNGTIRTIKASETDIDAETDDHKPIVSKTYRYAVNRVINDRFVTLTQSEYDALVTKDENTYYDIVEE